MNFWKIINLKQRRILTQYNSLSHITADVNWWKGHIDYKSSDSNSHKAIFYLLQARRHLAIMPGMYSREKCDKIDTPRMIFWRSKTGKDVLKQENYVLKQEIYYFQSFLTFILSRDVPGQRSAPANGITELTKSKFQFYTTVTYLAR